MRLTTLAWLTAGALSLSLPVTGQTTTMQTTPDDPYLWLEDIEGEKALDWVKRENTATDALIAMERGEVESTAVNWIGFKASKPDWISRPAKACDWV